MQPTSSVVYYDDRYPFGIQLAIKKSMPEFNGRNTEELAYLLWEKQGRPENRSDQNWATAEYLAHFQTPHQ